MKTDLGILASAVPFLFPKPRCLPIRRAAVSSRARARECIVTCFRIIRPSDTSLRIVWRELALEISLTSLGSSQILRFPHPITDAASRFWVRRLTLQNRKKSATGKMRCKNATAPCCAGLMRHGGQPRCEKLRFVLRLLKWVFRN